MYPVFGSYVALSPAAADDLAAASSSNSRWANREWTLQASTDSEIRVREPVYAASRDGKLVQHVDH